MHKVLAYIHKGLPCESCRERRLLRVVASGFDDVVVGVTPDVDGLEAAEGAAGACAVDVDGLGAAVDDVDPAAAAAPEDDDDDVALLAIANTVDAIEGLPSPPLNNEPLDTVLAAEANAPAGLDGTSVLAPLAVGCSAFPSPSAST